jgi:hypothetical protein
VVNRGFAGAALEKAAKTENAGENTGPDYDPRHQIRTLVFSFAQFAKAPAVPQLPLGALDLLSAVAAEFGPVEHTYGSQRSVQVDKKGTLLLVNKTFAGNEIINQLPAYVKGIGRAVMQLNFG